MSRPVRYLPAAVRRPLTIGFSMIRVISEKRLPFSLPKRSKILLVPLGLTIAVALLWVWGSNLNSFSRRDAYDYAQISVELFQGNGMSTLQLLPRHIPYLQERGLLEGPTWPNLSRNPLLMVVNLFFQRIFPNVARALVAQSGFWHLASLPLLFFLALRFTNLKYALAVVIFYAADREIILYSYSGMTETLAIFLLLALFLVAFKMDPKPLKWVLLGALAALAYLARAQFLVLLLWVLLSPWLTGSKSRRFLSAGLVLAGMLVALAPWMVRNFSLTGDPLFSFNTSRNLVKGTLPGQVDLELRLHAPVDVGLVVQQYREVILDKFTGNLVKFFSPAYWANNFRGMWVLFPGLFFFSLVRRQDGGEYDRLKWNTALLFFLTFLLISLTVDSVRYYLLFRPLILVVAFGELYFFLNRDFNPDFLAGRRSDPISSLPSASSRGVLDRFFSRLSESRSLLETRFLLVLVLLGLVQLAANTYQHTKVPLTYSWFELRTFEVLRKKTDRETLIASDISEQVSLYAGTRTLRLPADPLDLLEIHQKYIPVDYVLLSRASSRAGVSDEDEQAEAGLYLNYLDFIKQPIFLEQFTFDRTLPNGGLLFERK
jgi:hypothetical protein